ncbi:cycloisomaltooligosaccharide glucanotransferase [Paraliobacillus quinghaiensis]|uniref:Cycloisomaltooligosaccharide glucanotransferase n=1 Tax=Paraliobacillus quinghaiensis TaxID=470815 RepID=A0A917TUN4_9BACI|nr:glycoside hydrolase family 66 protein [Paraliobacillus quinghaiensis]GGM38795.1 cycloisomaltooligosaccharide glucanotransferase [Paraliobacillus quinghaiensis]
MNKNKLLLCLVILISAILALTGCTETDSESTSGEYELNTGIDPIVGETIEQGKWLGKLSTDLAAYKPGETVTLQMLLQEDVQEGKLVVNYKHLDESVYHQEVELNGEKEITWSWTPDDKDFMGYMVEVVLMQKNKPVDFKTIAVDVSSDWSKFPRYGYLADFPEMDEKEQAAVIENLNRYHINGIQFYDWQDRHDKPLKVENGEVATEWQDIANRKVSKKTVETYIKIAHENNMKAMNYNLLFGGNNNYEELGVKKEWGIYKDSNGKVQDFHPLPEQWKTDIFLFDPSNQGWQDFIFEQEKEVFEHLAFDGWHVDQLGSRGDVWDWNGEKLNLPSTYGPFMENAKERLQVDLVLNAVSQYGQAQIAQSPVEFLYTESWEHTYYKQLKELIDQNNMLSGGKLNTVLAAYMNYDLADSPGEFNTPGVLLTDAVIFASGGAHIELGENMLAKEYFPNKSLTITEELKEQLVNYYDFSVAYQNLLRDGAVEVEKEVNSTSDVSISNQAQKGSIWNFAKERDNKDILHFINFTDATTMEWKDNQGNQAEPERKEDISITVNVDKEVSNVWMASPDFYNGAAVDLEYQQEGDQLTFTLPSLKYWDMVVVEY